MKDDKKTIIVFITYVFLFFYNGYYLIHWGENLFAGLKYHYDIVCYLLPFFASAFLLIYTGLFSYYMIFFFNKKTKKVTKTAAKIYFALSIIAIVLLFYLVVRSIKSTIGVAGDNVFFGVVYTIRTMLICAGILSAFYIIFILVRYLKGDFHKLESASKHNIDGTSFGYEHPNYEASRMNSDPYLFDSSDVDVSKK